MSQRATRSFRKYSMKFVVTLSQGHLSIYWTAFKLRMVDLEARNHTQDHRWNTGLAPICSALALDTSPILSLRTDDTFRSRLATVLKEVPAGES